MPDIADLQLSLTSDRGFEPPGFLPGHGQPTQHVRFTLPAVERLDPAALDLWVAALLGDSRLQTPLPESPPGAPAAITTLAARVLRIAAELLRQSRVPRLACRSPSTTL